MEKINKPRGDSMRQLLELAISCGRSWQSSQTGYIHYCHTLQDEAIHHPIPTYENFLFVLALMRSRLTENIVDAKEILQRLLHFQSDKDQMSGNFPIYLHEYPYCKDRMHGTHLLPPLLWLYKQFHHVLGFELKQSLQACLLRLQSYCLQLMLSNSSPYYSSLKVASCAKVSADLFDRPDFDKDAELLFGKLVISPDQTLWYFPGGLSELIIAFQLYPQSIQNTFKQPFFEHLKQTWHAPSCSYCGPGWKERQLRFEPQVTLYDYFMGYLAGTLSQRCFHDHPVQLQAALIHPVEQEIGDFAFFESSKGMLNGLPWEIVPTQHFALSLLGKDESIVTTQHKLFSSLKLLWGNSHRLRSFVCQGGNIERVEYSIGNNQVDLYLSLFPECLPEDIEKNQEVNFYVDLEESMEIMVNDEFSTTFQLDDRIVISDNQFKIELSFHLHEGYGIFFGHVMKGNRPCQLAVLGAQRFATYDRQFFLRTLQRSEECTIRATLKIS